MNEQVELDAEGFLCDPAMWTEAVAEQLAAADQLALSAEHWLLIRLARTYYQQYRVPPGMRILVALLRQHYATTVVAGETPPRVDSRYLYRLFSESPGRQVCRYAGLPKPVSCI